MKRPRISQRALEFRARFAQLDGRVAEPVVGVEQHASPWFNSRDGANYLRQPTRDAFRQWAKRQGIVPVRRAGLLLYAKADIDRVLGLKRTA